MHAPCIGTAHRTLPLRGVEAYTSSRWWGDYSWHDVSCTHFNPQRMSASPRNGAIPDRVQPQIGRTRRPMVPTVGKSTAVGSTHNCSISVLSGEWDWGNLKGSTVMEEDQVWGCGVAGLHARFVVIRT